jgi:hypothetical protein
MWDVNEGPGEKQEQYYYNAYGSYYDDAAIDQAPIYDYGACTVEQLLLGVDERLVEKYGGSRQRRRQQRRTQKEFRNDRIRSDQSLQQKRTQQEPTIRKQQPMMP